MRSVESKADAMCVDGVFASLCCIVRCDSEGAADQVRRGGTTAPVQAPPTATPTVSWNAYTDFEDSEAPDVNSTGG